MGKTMRATSKVASVESLGGPFSLIVADPPWLYKNYRDARHGAGRSAMKPMTTEDIAAIPVAKFAAPECLMLLWGCWPQMDDHVFVAQRWGFKNITGAPWVKFYPSNGDLQTGIGKWFQATSEYFTLRRNSKEVRRPEDAPKVRGLVVGDECAFYAPVPEGRMEGGIKKKHSAKPPSLMDWLEEVAPPGPRLELWAGTQRPGWTCLGLETGWKLTPEGAVRIAKW